MSDKNVNHFVLADGSTAKYDAGALLNLDDTVSLAGYAPDAKAVGDRLTDVENFALTRDAIGLKLINLFDKETIIEGKYISAPGSTLGTNSIFFVSDFIKVNGLSEITMSYTHIAYWYDAEFSPLSAINPNSINEDQTLNVPSNAVYVRFSTYNQYLDTAQVGVGVSRENYVPHEKYHLNNLIVSASQVDGLTKLPDIFKNSNLFNPMSVANGKYVDGNNGNVYNLTGYVASYFIDIGTGNYVTVSNAFNAVVYKTDKSYSREITRKYANYPFTALLANDEQFIRISVKNENLNKAKVEINLGQSYYVGYGLTLDANNQNDSSYKLTKVFVGDGCYFTTINDALNAITDNSEKNRYIIFLTEGTYNETFHTKDYIDIEGESKYKSIIDYVSDNESDYINRSTIFATSYTKLKNLTVETTGSKYPLHCDGRYNEPYVVEAYNCKFKHNGFSGTDQPAGTAVGVGLYWGQHVKLVECECEANGVMGTASVYCHNSDDRDAAHSRFRSITLKNCSLENSTYGLRLQSIESNDLQANECIYIGNKNNGDTPVSLKDNGHQSWHIVSVGNTPEYSD